MDPEFWHGRWARNEIGFHQGEVNPHLRQFFPRLGLAPGQTVFVPLCGKSLDLLWLAGEGHPVVGVELSALALQAFVHENSVPAVPGRRGAFACWEGPDLRLLCGDFFELSGEVLGPVDALYDRAALIALPPALRSRYAARLQALVPAHAPILLVTLEYAQHEMQGPPFAVPESEVRALFPAYQVELLAEEDLLVREPRFREKGLSALREKVYLLRRG